MLDFELPLLIATDLDGTLLRDDKSVSTRTRDLLHRVEKLGIPVVPVTARQPYGLYPIIEPVGLAGPAICANGAVAVEIADRRVLFTRSISAEQARRVVAAARVLEPSVLCAAVGPYGQWFRAEAAYAAASTFRDHQRTRAQMEIVGPEEVAAECSKLVLRVVGEDPAVTLRRLGPAISPCQATISGAPFVEVMAEGVTKAAGVAALVERLGIPRERVWAFGDARNDVELLQWAGRGFAVANADSSAQEVADEVIASNEDDGVARQLESIFWQVTP